MAQCLMARVLPEGDVHLTERELAVLRRTGDGKTAQRISENLGISEPTVNFHIRIARTKPERQTSWWHGQGGDAGPPVLIHPLRTSM